VNPLPPAIAAIPGCIVTRLIVDDSFSLVLCGIDREVILRIDGAGRLQTAGESRTFDPDTDPASVVALVGLLNRRVGDVSLNDDGQLELRMGNTTMAVLPDEHQVSWSIHGPNGTRASCIAEGRVVWE
jgi:hypothetical protein